MVYSPFPINSKYKVRMTVHGGKYPETLFTDQFREYTGICFVPSLVFRTEAQCDLVRDQCPWILKHSCLGKECRELGICYKDVILEGKNGAAFIGWTGDEKGYGLFASMDLPPGTMIGHYAGLVRKLSRIHPDHNPYCVHYPTQLGSFHYYVIDARTFGNETRYINHSAFPNTEVKCALIDSFLYFVFNATHTIASGSEITCDYGPDYWQTTTPV